MRPSLQVTDFALALDGPWASTVLGLSPGQVSIEAGEHYRGSSSRVRYTVRRVAGADFGAGPASGSMRPAGPALTWTCLVLTSTGLDGPALDAAATGWLLARRPSWRWLVGHVGLDWGMRYRVIRVADARPGRWSAVFRPVADPAPAGDALPSPLDRVWGYADAPAGLRPTGFVGPALVDGRTGHAVAPLGTLQVPICGAPSLGRPILVGQASSLACRLCRALIEGGAGDGVAV